jgi:addiction module HigA family antidote
MVRNPMTAGLKPMHPGELLREEILPAIGKPKTEIAELLGIGRQTLYDILSERKPVTTQMALRIGKLAGNGPEFWLNLQQQHDLAIAEKKLAREIAKIPNLNRAA